MKARAILLSSILMALAAVVFVFGGGAPVVAQGVLSFSIAPAQVDGAPARSYFTYTLEPGETIADQAFVVNDSDAALDLKLFVADGVTAINGSTAFANEGEVRNGVRDWLSVSIAQVQVGPGEARAIPFTLNVPPGTPPGDHVAGLVVEGPPKAPGGPGVGATLVERAGVAIVVRVPGEATEQLALGGACLNQETGSNYFEFVVENQGNLLTKASGTLSLMQEGGELVFIRPIELGTVLPADRTLLRVDAPLDPGPGVYEATLSLTQTDGSVVRSNSTITIAEEKVNGCGLLTVGEDGAPSGRVSDIQENLHEPTGGWHAPSMTVILGLLLALVAAVLVAREILWRRRAK